MHIGRYKDDLILFASLFLLPLQTAFNLKTEGIIERNGGLVETIITLDSVCIRSEDVVSRDIMGELLIVPLVSGIGDMEDEIYTLNETGRAIWELLDGNKSLKEIVNALTGEYEAPAGKIERDVLGIVSELFRRRMVVAIGKD